MTATAFQSCCWLGPQKSELSGRLTLLLLFRTAGFAGLFALVRSFDFSALLCLGSFSRLASLLCLLRWFDYRVCDLRIHCCWKCHNPPRIGNAHCSAERSHPAH